MNPISVLLVLVVFSGLQDYVTAMPGYTANKIYDCAYEVYKVMNAGGSNPFPDVRLATRKSTVHSKVQEKLNIAGVPDAKVHFDNCLTRVGAGVDASTILDS